MTAAQAIFLPILTFHALEELPSVISFTPELFRRGIKKLITAGYRAISLTEATERMRHEKTLPERSFVITFDDGYESVYREALPVLQDFGLSATVFLTVGKNPKALPDERLPNLEGRSMLSWREILEMQKYGIDFGAHTLTHPDLTKLSPCEIENEVAGSKKIIEDATGSAVPCFAYPFGRFDERTRTIARRYFGCACSDKLGIVNAQSDIYALERVDSYYIRSEKTFALMPTKFFSRYIMSRSFPRHLRRLFRYR